MGKLSQKIEPLDVVEAFERTALACPERTAFQWLRDGEEPAPPVTFGALHLRVRSLAARLRELAAPGARVLLAHRPGAEFVASLLATMAAGHVAIPTYPPRRDRPGRSDPAADRWRHVVATAAPELVIAEREYALEGAACLATPSVPDDPDADALAGPTPDVPAFLQFTSGSTGDPRGVVIRRHHLAANVAAIRACFRGEPGEVTLTWLPPYHDMGLVGALVTPLVIGMPIVAMAPAAFLQRPVRWLEAISRFRVAVSGGPDFAFQRLVQVVTDQELARLDLSCWRLAYNGAEPVRPETVRSFVRRFAAANLPPTMMTPCYGLAEATLMVTSADAGVGARIVEGRVSCGPPLPGFQVRIVDPDSRAERPPGDEGEIEVSGPSVADGYWSRPEETAATFRTERGTRWLATGDLGRLVGGALLVTGRRKDVIVVDGRNVAPHDIEAAIEGIDDRLVPHGAAALSVERGGRERVVVVQEVEDARLDWPRILGAVRRAVAEAVGVTVDDVIPVRRGTLPRTTSGKVRRGECRRRVLAGELHEVRVAVDWLEVVRREAAAQLGVAASTLGADRPLVELGLDSRGAVELAGALARAADTDLPPTLCWDHPTLNALAAYLGGAPRPSAQPVRGAAGPIAVVGLACRLPGADDLDALHALLRGGRVVQDTVPPASRPDREPLGPGAYLADPASFDAERFSISPREAERMDPQQRLLLELTVDALHHAAIDPATLRGGSAGVFVGISNVDWRQRLEPDPYAGPAGAASIAANRISYQLDLRGPSMAIDTACSSSLVALHQAARALEAGECELVIVGGVNLVLDAGPTQALAAAGMLSPTGRCRPFDAGADGYVRGEGCVVAVLEPLERARAQGHPIFAVLGGSAVGQDGRSNGLTAPNGAAQRRIVEAALARAGLEPGAIGYVEAHGTGTPLGDPIEWSALAETFAGGAVAVGSIKANVGHLEAAAGLAGFVKACLAVHHGVMFPHAVERPSPVLARTEALHLAGPSSRWPSGPRRAGVSSFGFGGTGAHAIVEQPPEPTRGPAGRRVVMLSARRAADLPLLAARWERWLDAHPEAGHDAVAAALTAGRPAEPHRWTWTAGTREELSAGLRAPAWRSPPDGAPEEPRVALLVAGHGSDPVGAARGWYGAAPAFSQVIDRAEELLTRGVGWGVRDVLLGRADPAEGRRPSRVQPALVALALAQAAELAERGVRPIAVLGHSLGELAAASLSGALQASEALTWAAHRGRLVEELALPGKMASILGDASELVLGEDTVVAADNGPGHVVVSGAADEVDRWMARAAERGYSARDIEVGQAYHSARMDPVCAALGEVVGRSRRPDVPWLSTVTGGPVGAVGPQHWVDQLRRRVRYREAFDALLRDHRPTALVELGVRPVLARWARSRGCSAVGPCDDPVDHLAALLAAGVPVDRAALAQGTTRAGGGPGPIFHRSWHWRAPARRHPRADRHPLLGNRVLLQGVDQALFQSTVSLEADPELDDHRAFQAVVVAGASQVSLLLSAHLALGGAPAVTVRTPTFSQGLLVEPGVARATQLAIEPARADGSRPFRFVSYPTRAVDASDLRVHAVGALGPAPEPEPPVDLHAIRARCGHHLDQEAFYALVARHHIQAGPSYRWCAEAWTGDGESLGRMSRPASVPANSGYDALHPGLVDSSFQLAAVAQLARQDEAFLLFRIGEYRLHRLPDASEPLWTHALRRPGPADAPVQRFVIRLVDDRGGLVAEAVDLELRRASLQGVLRSLRPDAFDDLFYEVRWTPWRPSATPRARHGWWVVGGAPRGFDAREVEVDEIRARVQAGERPAGLLFVAPDRVDAEGLDADGLLAAQARGAHALLRAVQHLGDLRVPVVAVTRGAMPEAAGGAGFPAHAPIRGLAKVLAAERPDADVQVIDLQEGAPVGDLAEVLLGGAGEPEVALRADGPHVPRLEPAGHGFVTDAAQLDASAAYVVTGGTGGLGLAFARWLVGRGARHVVLWARSAPSGDALQVIDRLLAFGAEVRVDAVDVASERSVRAGWGRIEQPVRGIIHAAGVLADAVVEHQGPELFHRAMAPKVAGAWNLHRVAPADGLDFFVVCSSIASLMGSPGQAAYAAANAFLDAFAAWRPGTTAIWWGPWAEVGMAARQGPEHRAALERSGVVALDPELAVEGLEQARRAPSQLAIARIDWSRVPFRSPLVAGLKAGVEPPALPQLAASLRDAPSTAGPRVERFLERLLAELSGGAVDAGRSIQSLGLDSLMALDAQSRIKAELGVDLHVTSFLRDVSVSELASEITQQLLADTPPASTPSTAPPPGAAGPVTTVALARTPAPSAAPSSEFALGLFFFSRTAADDTGYALLHEAARFADEAGLGSVWLPERHFHPFGGLYPNPSVLAASLAPVTRNLRLRAGSVVLPLHHPARVAEEWSVVDRLSGGRVDLAFVRGWGPNDFALRPEDFEDRTQVLEERLDQVRRLWRGEAVSFPNGAGDLVALQTWPRPVQPELPVWLTCTQHDERFVAAGRLGVNVLTALLLQSPEELARRIALYREARASHGHDPSAGRVALMVHTFVGEDDAEIRRQVQQPLEQYLASSVDLWRGASSELRDADRYSRERLLQFAVERYYATSGLFGPRDACVATARRFRDLGVDELACLVDFGVQDELVLQSVRHLPAIQEAVRRGDRGGP